MTMRLIGGDAYDSAFSAARVDKLLNIDGFLPRVHVEFVS
jgi:hypothetical protein